MPISEADLITGLGLTAGGLTTIAFLPQLIQIYRSRSAKDVSVYTFAIFSIGVFLWILYGIAIRSWPVIATNIVTFILALCILFLRWKYNKK